MTGKKIGLKERMPLKTAYTKDKACERRKETEGSTHIELDMPSKLVNSANGTAREDITGKTI